MHQCPSSIVIRVHTRQLHGETEEDEGREKRRVQNLTWRRFLSFVCVCVLQLLCTRVAALIINRGQHLPARRFLLVSPTSTSRGEEALR